VYCPLCGNKMEYVEDRTQPPEIDWYEDDTETIKRKEAMRKAYESCKREELWCPTKQCFGKDYPLYFHGVWGGIESAPGDSWSLSWVK